MVPGISAFHHTGIQSSIDTIKKHNKLLNKIIPDLVTVMADGSIKVKKSQELLQGYLDKEKIIPLVQNFNNDSSVANNLITDGKATDVFIFNIIDYLDQEKYSGLCIDIKGIKHEFKEHFNDFIKKAVLELNTKGYSLSVVIPAKAENNHDSTWSGAYDFKSLGKAANNIIVMSTDFHWPGGTPGPIAPLFWVQDVIDYAILEIPLEKIYFSFGLYGYDWSLSTEEKARELGYMEICEIVEKYNTRIEWDQESESPYIRYKSNGHEHELWFENKRSIEKKIYLVNEFHLQGIVFWKLGQEDPGIWDLFSF